MLRSRSEEELIQYQFQRNTFLLFIFPAILAKSKQNEMMFEIKHYKLQIFFNLIIFAHSTRAIKIISIKSHVNASRLRQKI